MGALNVTVAPSTGFSLSSLISITGGVTVMSGRLFTAFVPSSAMTRSACPGKSLTGSRTNHK